MSLSYGEATQLGPNADALIANPFVFTATTIEPSLLEIYAGAHGLAITSCGVIVVTACTGTAAVITLQRRPRPGVEASEVDFGTIPLNATNGATVGNVVESVFQTYAENASGVSQIEIPPGQSFVMDLSTAMGTAGVIIPFANGYRYPIGSKKVSTTGELIGGDSVASKFNVNITAS